MIPPIIRARRGGSKGVGAQHGQRTDERCSCERLSDVVNKIMPLSLIFIVRLFWKVTTQKRLLHFYVLEHVEEKEVAETFLNTYYGAVRKIYKKLYMHLII